MKNHEMSLLKEKIHHGNLMLPMNVYHIGEEREALDLYLHWHNEMEIIYVTSGKGTFYIDLQAYEASTGDLMIIKPDTLHSGSSEKGYVFECKTIVFSLNMLKSFISDSSQLNFINPLINKELDMPVILHKDSCGYNSIINSFVNLIEVHEEKYNGYELEIKSLLFHIFAMLFKENHVKRLDNIKDVENKNIEKIKTVLHYIHTNFNEDIPISKLATMINFSPFHFIRFFKKNTGQTCTQYINAIRLEKSAKLLIDTKLPITDIALEVGFNNTSYFIKLFKVRYNFSPLAYRRSFGGDSQQ